MIKEAIATIVAGNDLTSDKARSVMNEIMQGQATQAQSDEGERCRGKAQE
jgi:anthranilate phosphoribosyltransferase